MLDKEKIIKNAKVYHDRAVSYGVSNDELLSLLGIEFITAPCTTSSNMYGAYEGGLIKHLLNVTKHAVRVNTSLSDSKKVDEKSLIRVSLVHQIGKAKMFIPQESEWHRKNKGEMFTWNESLLSMTVAERSVYYLLKSGVELTEDEVYAIHNFNSDFASRPLKAEGEKIAAILRVANLIATIEEK
jgi:hypothetical protein